jgi:hypothetical protein
MDGDGVAFEERRSGLWDQCGEGTIDGVHLIVEILGALGETPDRHVRCELDLVGTLTEPHRSSLRHEAGLVTMLEPGTDLIRATDHDLAQLVQRLEPLHACRTTGDHQHSHLLQRAITPLRRHAGFPRQRSPRSGLGVDRIRLLQPTAGLPIRPIRWADMGGMRYRISALRGDDVLWGVGYDLTYREGEHACSTPMMRAKLSK